MSDQTQQQKVKSLRLLQWLVPLSTVIVAVGLYVGIGGDIGKLAGGIFLLMGAGEFFMFRAMADKAERDLP